MSELNKLLRTFQLLNQLQRKQGCDKESFSTAHGISTRTFDRYIRLLRTAGFSIIFHRGRYFLQSASSQNLHDEYLHFSLDEAGLLQKAMELLGDNSPLAISVCKKLNFLTDSEKPQKGDRFLTLPGKIRAIREAIRTGRRVKLKNYQPADADKPIDREIEPAEFLHYHQYVEAFDPGKMEMRMFRISRAESVQLLRKKQKFRHLHTVRPTDPFLLTGQPFDVELLMSNRARILLLDEVELNENYQWKRIGENQWLFSGEMRAFEGIGRFILGLPGEIQILKPEGLQQYVQLMAARAAF